MGSCVGNFLLLFIFALFSHATEFLVDIQVGETIYFDSMSGLEVGNLLFMRRYQVLRLRDVSCFQGFEGLLEFCLVFTFL